ncbi:MAG: protein kinase [Candidatus Sericytochromatia bacterium]|nr:protein kinase [Candidatus Sericytochromatia bacterium]
MTDESAFVFEEALELNTLADLEGILGFEPTASRRDAAAADTAPDASSYELMLQVGAGAMGEVFLARDRALLRRVAYKRLLSEVNVNAEVLGRFVREVQITAQLEHPNVVPVYSLEKTSDGWAYAMKLVFGKTLKELIQTARSAWEQGHEPEESLRLPALLDHFLKVCDALSFAHDRGVLHRDLKPANIMVGGYGEVYVMDWGIARVMGQADLDGTVELNLPDTGDEEVFEATRMGQILGTPRYLSPEQAAGKNDQLDGRSDLFALGLILYELTLLKPAYHASKLTELLKKVLKAEKAPPKALHPRQPLPRELLAIITKATARRREDRYARVQDLAADIRRYLRGEAVLAQPDTPLQAGQRWLLKHLAASVLVILGTLFSLGALTTWTLWQQQQTQTRLFVQTRQLQKLQAQVASRAQEINSGLLALHAPLRALEAEAAARLQSSQVSTQPVFAPAAFATPGREPADYAYYPRYARFLSLSAPVLQAPPASDTALQALAGLTPVLARQFRQLLPPEQQSAYAQVMAEEGLPLVWAQIATAQGALLTYPGQTGFDESFDPRQQAWYQQALSSQQPQWSSPYIDPLGQGLLLALSLPIQAADPAQPPLGVVALELSIQYLIDTWLFLELPGVQQHYLLNAKGEIVVRSSDRDRLYGLRFGQVQAGQTIDTPLFDQPRVLTELQTGRSGYLRLQRNGIPVWLAFYRLEALGWYYLVEVEERAFLAAAD